jgi:dipeptidyl aminopeptidase/acylaminoacyl peptidase
MRRAAFAVCLTLALIPERLPGTPSAEPGRLTVPEILAADASGRRPSQLAWAPDGSRLAYVWDDGEGEALWSLDPRTGDRRLLLRLKELAETGEDSPGIEDPIWSPKGDALLAGRLPDRLRARLRPLAPRSRQRRRARADHGRQ